MNSAALAALGIDDTTPDPPFGAFDRDPVSGEMTGLAREAAAQLFVERIHVDDSVDDLMAGLREVFDEFLGYGITSVYNSLTSSKAIQAFFNDTATTVIYAVLAD
jgi:predicted amidohydrolase YtcJ